MNLSESLASLRNKLESLDIPPLNEDKGHGQGGGRLKYFYETIFHKNDFPI